MGVGGTDGSAFIGSLLFKLNAFLFLFSVGRPISVIHTHSPSSEEIDRLHETYLHSLTDLFEQHKHAYGLSQHQHLTFI